MSFRTVHNRLLLTPIIIFLIAATLRMLYLYQIKDDIFMANLIVDAKYYDAWARQISAGDWLGKEVFWQDPLYAYILAIIYKLLGPYQLWARVFQGLLDSCTCLLIFHLGSKLWNSAAGCVAAAIYCLYPLTIFYVGLLDKTTVSIFTITFSMTLLVSALESGRWPLLLGSGLLFGLSSLVRGNMVLVSLIGIPLLLLLQAQKPWSLRSVKIAAIFLSGVVGPIFCVTLRNWFVARDFVPITANAGWFFYLGNQPSSLGTLAAVWECTTPDCESASARFQAERISGESFNKSGEVSRFWLKYAVKRIIADPMSWLKLLSQKLYIAFNNVELADSYDFYYFSHLSPILRIFPAGYSLILALGCLGFFLVRDWRPTAPLLFFLISYLGTLLVFTVSSRYRLPLIIPLILSAGRAIEQLPSRLKSKSLKMLALPLLLSSTLFVIGYVQLPFLKSIIQSSRATAYGNAALILRDKNELNEALDFIEKAIELMPTSSFAWQVKGEILYALEKIKEAEGAFEKSVQLNPREDQALNYLGAVYIKTRRLKAAADCFKAAAEASTIPERIQLYRLNYADTVRLLEKNDSRP